VRVRWWLLAVVCAACGLISRLVFCAYARAGSRVEAGMQWEFQVQWYGAALLLFLLHLWRLGTRGRPPAEVPSCGVALLAVVGAVLAFVLAAAFSLPRD
jgi:hypothetical protein